jgi:hypothetical protein
MGPIELRLPISQHSSGRVEQASAALPMTETRTRPAGSAHVVETLPRIHGDPDGVRAASLRQAVKEFHRRKDQTHPPHDMFRQRHQPEPAGIPDAVQRNTWKTPYSYGFFGGSRDRRWQRHFGYRDRGTAWTLR